MELKHDDLISSMVKQTCRRFQNEYLGAHGLIVIALDASGKIVRDTPLIGDFGDALPFLYYFGLRDFALEQVRRAGPYLWNGLYVRDGRIRASFNHDFLLGLVELHCLSGERWLLDQAMLAVHSLLKYMSARDIIVDQIWPNTPNRRPFPRARPYNGGFIEVFVDLYRATGDADFLEQANSMARTWVETPFFQHHGLFRCREFVGSDLLSCLATRFSRSGRLVQLFKDNTNLVHSLLALFRQTGQACWREALARWVEAFTRYFWNDGNVYMWLDRKFDGCAPQLKAAFSALDLLCDLYNAGIGRERTLELARAVGDFWLAQQWPDGLFPATPGGDVDHLDANTDLAIALHKLSSLTQDERYRRAGRRCCEALLVRHASLAGYVLSIHQDGQVADEQVSVKYQGLLLKLALLPEGDLYSQPEILSLLRDR